MRNINQTTVDGFGDEWTRFDQRALPPAELKRAFEQYFSIFPWDQLPANAEGFDLGCGSGRWAACVAPRVGTLHCIDASSDALRVARANLGSETHCRFHHASVDSIPLADASMDFGYSLGVLHHVPDTQEGIRECVRKLKPGAPFLIYLYYRFDNRPSWFRNLWAVSDLSRKVISRLPARARQGVTDIIAASVYVPLARLSRALDRLGVAVSNMPLSAYRDASFYTMRTDARDRFGTRLEQRFTRSEIFEMMERAGLERITFREDVPFWCALGFRRE